MKEDDCDEKIQELFNILNELYLYKTNNNLFKTDMPNEEDL